MIIVFTVAGAFQYVQYTLLIWQEHRSGLHIHHLVWGISLLLLSGFVAFATERRKFLAGIDRCKLQMMRTAPQKNGWELGPALAAGLTLRFYPAFEICTETLPKYKERVAREMADYDRFAIHTLVSQTADGALTLGDSHEYGLAVDIFNKTEIDELVMRNVREFLIAPDLSIAERWYGVYAKHPDKSWVAIDAAPGVRIVTAVGGSGMTLSFGLAEEMIREMHI